MNVFLGYLMMLSVSHIT